MLSIVSQRTEMPLLKGDGYTWTGLQSFPGHCLFVFCDGPHRTSRPKSNVGSTQSKNKLLIVNGAHAYLTENGGLKQYKRGRGFLFYGKPTSKSPKIDQKHLSSPRNASLVNPIGHLLASIPPTLLEADIKKEFLLQNSIKTFNGIIEDNQK